ncbi:kinase domain protein, putative [Rhizoctonia solani AG-3 Rhs1AP]|uniref:Kinase domain protein, putative n=1 Tax=Rhizoctonia solani AG-3 Rhs1AP TaxID=1086054 RepID=X8J892_9AGAM|nr:kinase domain protein, putative [Rhizoctonia solani AG-3 Rhs1AP]
MDVAKDGEAFTRAFASLLMLDRIDEGYDPAFTFERDDAGRLVYYIDLPEAAFSKTCSKSTPMVRNGRTRRFKVTEILCHRESICGRATIVLRIREELESEGQDPKEYALKMIWRDPERGSEGEILGQVHGRFGLSQSIWYCDVSMPGKCQCAVTEDEWCPSCVDQTVQVKGLHVCDKLRDINIVVPLEDEGEEQVEHVDTTKCRPTTHVRPLRTYSYIVMESIGAPLWQAETPRRFLTAVLDAILGYWGAFNMGIMHRDISDGNVLMLTDDPMFTRREWLEPRVVDLRIQDPTLMKSEEKLRAILEEIGHRDPTGMLSDFDLYAMHSSVANLLTSSTGIPGTTDTGPAHSSRRRPEGEAPSEPNSKRRKTNSRVAAPVLSDPVSTQEQNQITGEELEIHSQRIKRRLIDFRTGTPAFMSVCVLNIDAGTPYHHHFFDDLESFFWLLLWCTAAHLDEGKRHPTPAAQDTLNDLNQEKLKSMRTWKRAFLADAAYPQDTARTLENFRNEWASDPLVSSVIINMGVFLSEFARPENRERLQGSPDEAFSQVVTIFLDALGPNK